MEDMRFDSWTDRDYNDLIFQVRGAVGKAALMNDVVAAGKDWRTSDLGQALVEYAKAYITPEPVVDDVVSDSNNSGNDGAVSPELPVEGPVDSSSPKLPVEEPVDSGSVRPELPIEEPVEPISINKPIDPAPTPATDTEGTKSSPITTSAPDTEVTNNLPTQSDTPITDILANQPISDNKTDILTGNQLSEATGVISKVETFDSATEVKDNLTGESQIIPNNANNITSTPAQQPSITALTPSPLTFEFPKQKQPLTGIIASEQNNSDEISKINKNVPLWNSSGPVGSDNWPQSLVQFVDAAKKSGQPNAIINISPNLTTTNPDGSVTTRSELTAEERAAIAYAQKQNVLVVVPAGDTPGKISALGQLSKEFDNIITVGAATRVNNSVAPSKAFALGGNSGSGAALDILADGSSSAGSGTAVAAAKVAGAASQIWAANPQLNYTQVIDLIKRTATDLSKPNWDTQTAAGLLNITAAVNLAKVTKPEPYTVKPGQRTITDNFISQPNADKFRGRQAPHNA